MRTWAVATAALAVLGPLAGLLWHQVSPHVHYVVLQHRALLADPEGQGPIGVDGRFALITALAGLACGGAAYLFGGRGNDVPLVAGLATGGTAAALLAWRTGHQIGLGAFQHAVRTAADGRTVTGPATLGATGVLVFWPLLAVAAYALLELLVKRLPAGDGRLGRGGEAGEVGGGELDLEAAPSGGDVDRREP
ncbi:hypothetical protein [Actinomadura parmotrematis]|uniref:DUF2567 domain-containing protein n=1 Tax=Actinomadura parmotrematis TaxID=2864039 RepID=A0ABS7FKZ4_9ACTN|nr:hypothetical protein [Actinomadura parmotrematis]MBW8481040.1 hypothetical protein [Actinomadura parmotrematis]